jgi:hypothetical protein
MRVRACSASKPLRDSITGFPWVTRVWTSPAHARVPVCMRVLAYNASTVDGLDVRCSDVKFDGGEGNAVFTKKWEASIYERGQGGVGRSG